MGILLETDHFHVKNDERYSTGDFETLLRARLDADDDLEEMFLELLSIVRAQADHDCERRDSLMEKGGAGILVDEGVEM